MATLLRIGLIQMTCEKGALSANLKLTSQFIEEAIALGIDILVFPETSLCGYANPDKYPQAVVGLDGVVVSEFLAMTSGHQVMVLAGILERNPCGKPYITHLVANTGDLIGLQRKMTVGEEEQGYQPENWFTVGSSVNVFKHKGVTFGIAICADLGNPFVFTECARQGADIVFEVAAPGLYGEQTMRDWTAGFRWWKGEVAKYLGQYTRQHHYWAAVATQAGRTSDEDFPGGAYVYTPGGERVFASPDGSPGAVYLEIDTETGRVVELL
jgi:predicted amidohydrolase